MGVGGADGIFRDSSGVLRENDRTGKRPRRQGLKYAIKVVLMNITLYPLLAAWTLLGIMLSPLVFPGLKLVSRRPADQVVRQMVWLYGKGWLLLFSPFVRFTAEGMEELEGRRPRIIVVNHLSFFDTFCMGLFPEGDIVFAVRSWPFRILFYRPFMRLARYLDVEGNGWDALVESAGKTLGQNSSILFFPEGHRSPDGRIRRFHSGAFKLAVETGVPVVPMCITGSDALLPPGRFWLGPAHVRLRALPPVSSAEFSGESGHMALRRKVKAVIAENLAQMRAEGGKE